MPPDWIESARSDAAARGLTAVVPLLDGLKAAIDRLRVADWNTRLADGAGPDREPSGGAASDARAVRGASTATATTLDALTIVEAARGLRAGRFTASSLAEAALARIAAEGERLNAFITVTADLAREAAAAADADLRKGIDRGPLQGIPVSLKDLIDLEGFPTTAASRVRRGHVARADAPLVAHLKRAGAVIVGKTNLHEFAFGTTSEDSAFGPARHPRDPARSPGGSSGGSAASVAAGMCLATVGSDTGGSIRIPAALCGLVGLKAGFGEVSCEGVVPLSLRLDHVGPLAKTVEDARLLYLVLAGRPPDPPAIGPPPLASLRLGLPRGPLAERLQEEVDGAFRSAIDALRSAGASVLPVDVPHAADAAAVYLPLVLAEAAALHAHTLDTRPDDYTPPVRARLEMGRYVPGEDCVRALRGVEVLRAEVDAALRTCDCLVMPTVPIQAPEIGTTMVRLDGREESIRNAMLRQTQPFNLTRHPAISLPIGPPDALPVGLQLVGMDTDRLLAIAAALEPVLRR